MPCRQARSGWVEVAEVPAASVDVLTGIAPYVFDIAVVQLADAPCGRALDQRTGRKFLALGDQRAGPDDAVFADFGVIHDAGLHADQDPVADRAAVKDRHMADRHRVADRDLTAGMRMQGRQILDVRAGPDVDRTIVAAHDRAEPDARIRTDGHIADDRSVPGEKYLVGQLGTQVPEPMKGRV